MPSSSCRPRRRRRPTRAAAGPVPPPAPRPRRPARRAVRGAGRAARWRRARRAARRRRSRHSRRARRRRPRGRPRWRTPRRAGSCRRRPRRREQRLRLAGGGTGERVVQHASSSARPTNTGLTDLVSTAPSIAQGSDNRGTGFRGRPATPAAPPPGPPAAAWTAAADRTGAAAGPASPAPAPASGCPPARVHRARRTPPLSAFVAPVPRRPRGGRRGGRGRLADQALVFGLGGSVRRSGSVELVLVHGVPRYRSVTRLRFLAMPQPSSPRGVRHIGRVPHLPRGLRPGGLRSSRC